MLLESGRIKQLGEEVWKYLEGFDIIGLLETWLDKKGWNRIEKFSNFKTEFKSDNYKDN